MTESALNNEHVKRSSINISTPPPLPSKDFPKDNYFMKNTLITLNLKQNQGYILGNSDPKIYKFAIP